MSSFGSENVIRQKAVASERSPSAIRPALTEEVFRKMLALERKRAERSNDFFVLMLVESDGPEALARTDAVLDYAIASLTRLVRETDVVGWYEEKCCLGVIFSGLQEGKKGAAVGAILKRVGDTIRKGKPVEEMNQIRLSFYVFPDDWEKLGQVPRGRHALYPDIERPADGKKKPLVIKRMIDIIGAGALLVVFAPIFLLIAVAIKTTSRGPVLFRQERVGQFGKRFAFLKFRSMHVDSDHSVHREYIRGLIAGNAIPIPLENDGQGVYKLVNDERITPVGKILRRTSLDELPQLWNVVRGDMSLVGPRPAIPYEVSTYRAWHRRRLLAVKPGITGLWQIEGRSRVTFDEMVRLDLRYALIWSLWLDFKILLRTPGAVVKGAY